MSSILNTISKFNSPFLIIIVFICYLIIKIELQTSAFNKRKIFGEYLLSMNSFHYWLLIIITFIDMIFTITFMAFCINDKSLWLLGIILLLFSVFFMMLIYSMLSYPHLYKRDKFPSYENKDNETFVILDIFKNKAQVALLNPSNYKNKKFIGLNDSNKRYITNINKISGIYYMHIKNDYKNHFIMYWIFIALLFVILLLLSSAIIISNIWLIITIVIAIACSLLSYEVGKRHRK